MNKPNQHLVHRLRGTTGTDQIRFMNKPNQHPLVHRLREAVGTTDADNPPFYNDLRDATAILQLAYEALQRCHESFRKREHGGVAEQRLRHDLEAAFKMPYQ